MRRFKLGPLRHRDRTCGKSTSRFGPVSRL